MERIISAGLLTEVLSYLGPCEIRHCCVSAAETELLIKRHYASLKWPELEDFLPGGDRCVARTWTAFHDALQSVTCRDCDKVVFVERWNWSRCFDCYNKPVYYYFSSSADVRKNLGLHQKAILYASASAVIANALHTFGEHCIRLRAVVRLRRKRQKSNEACERNLMAREDKPN